MIYKIHHYCIHGIHASEICGDCERDIADGWVGSRQVYTVKALYKKRQILTGKCFNCGKPLGDSPYRGHCRVCKAKQREYQRKVGGFKEKVAGGRGRPLKVKQRRRKRVKIDMGSLRKVRKR